MAWWWDGGGIEEQCASAIKGCKWGTKHCGKEGTFLSPFWPVLAQSSMCFVRFAIVSREKSCLSFIASYIADIYLIRMSYILLYYT